MSRAIKFRAWDRANCVMLLEPFAWDNVRDEIIGENGEFLQGDPTDRYVLMQFTGLTDKNGREIYESDRMQGSYGIPPVKLVGEVAFEDGAFYVLTPNHNPERALLDSALHWVGLEVIGNIYENPELMEDGSNG